MASSDWAEDLTRVVNQVLLLAPALGTASVVGWAERKREEMEMGWEAGAK